MSTTLQQQRQRAALQKVQQLLQSTRYNQIYFNALVEQYQYVHPALNVVHDDVKGRGLKATRDIPAGTILISNPSGNRVDLIDNMDTRSGNIHLGFSLFARSTLYGFNLDPLSIPNDTLGLPSDAEQPEYITGDSIGTRGKNAEKEYPLSEVSPVLPEYLCPNLSKLPDYPNPFLYQDKDGTIQHIPMKVPESLPAELRTNLINAMRDQQRGYPLLMRCVLMAQENSVLTPFNIPFLLPHQYIKPKPIPVEDKKKTPEFKKPAGKTTTKVTAKVTAANKKTAAAAKDTKKDETQDDEDATASSLKDPYNFFKQLKDDSGIEGEDIPANLLRFCRLQEDDDDDEDDEEDEEEEEQKPQPKNAKGGKANNNKNNKNNKKKQEEEEEEEEFEVEANDQLVLFPTFALLNHNCKPNSTPLFFHVPTSDYLQQVYKEHRELLSKQKDGDKVPATFNLPREASLASLAVVVALNDIKAGEELTINYTPLAHCESSANLNNNAPVIQYIPWMQEFRKAQMRRVHNMVCTCSTCAVDSLIQKASGATLLEVLDENKKSKAAGNKEDEKDAETTTTTTTTTTETPEAEAEKKSTEEEVKPLEPLIKIEDEEIVKQLQTVNPEELAQRLLLHTIVINDKQSTFNRNALPLLMFRDRVQGGENTNPIPQHPNDLIARFRAVAQHPLFNAYFASRGGYTAVNAETPLLTIEEIFDSSRALLKNVAAALQKGRETPSAVNVDADGVADVEDKTLQQDDVFPIILPQAFNVVNEVKTDASVKTAIVASSKATLVPTINQLEATTALATSIGLYAAISGGYERLQVYGVRDEDMPQEEEEEPTADLPVADVTEDDLFDTEVTTAGTQSKEEILKARAAKKTAAVVTADGSVIKNDIELKKKRVELRAYREMAHVLEALVLEVLGINESEGRKEYVLPTHWFVSSCLGLLHGIYLKLGANIESFFCVLYLTYITGISVPLSNVKEVEFKPKHHTPTQLREAKKITEKWTYQEALDPIPGFSVKPIHPTLTSLLNYMTESLDGLLPALRIVGAYTKAELARVSAEDYVPEEGEEPLDKAKLQDDFDFIESLTSAIFFLGRSVEKYMF